MDHPLEPQPPTEPSLSCGTLRPARRIQPSIRRSEKWGDWIAPFTPWSRTCQTPSLDEPLRQLSNAANLSKLWLGAAVGIAAVGGHTGRRAAITGVVAIGVASAVVNQGSKRLYPRDRPDRKGEEVPEERHVRMPYSTSFPSGHSASGFAFAAAVSSQLPVVGAGLRFLAGAVAYSRVHTGVHYPGDAIVGSLVGAGVGSMVAAAARRFPRYPTRR